MKQTKVRVLWVTEYDHCFYKFLTWLNNTTYNEQKTITYKTSFINNGVISDKLPEGAVSNYLKSLAKNKENDHKGE